MHAALLLCNHSSIITVNNVPGTVAFWHLPVLPQEWLGRRGCIRANEQLDVSLGRSSKPTFATWLGRLCSLAEL